MRFELIQRFSSAPDAVAAAYADPALYATLVDLPKLGRIEVLGHEADQHRARLRVRFAFTGHLAPAVTAVVDPDRLTWVQESTHDLPGGDVTFRLVPDHYPDRLAASGQVRHAPDGDGTRRTVAGELKVRALLVGGKVEQAIVSGLSEYLDAEATVVDRFIAG